MKISEKMLEQRKSNLVHAAYELFCEHGIEAVSLTQISKRSKVSLGSIYHYYESKAVLVEHTQDMLWYELAEQLLSESSQQRSQVASGIEEISILLLKFQELYEKHSTFLQFACEYKLYLIRHQIKLPAESYIRLISPVYQAFTGALERGRRDGSIPSDRTVDDQFFTIWGVLWSSVEQMVLMDNIYGGDNPFRSRFQIVIDSAIDRLKK